MHKHHIIPKSRGGTDDEWNLRDVTPFDHAYGHALDFVLFKQSPMFDCRCAGWCELPSGLKDAVRNELRIRRIKMNKDKDIREKVSKGLTGRIRTPEHCKAISKSKVGKRSGTETSRKRHSVEMSGSGNPFYGKSHSDETRLRISLKKRGQKTVSKTVVCPHCGKVGVARGMKRWHFENCKQKEN